MLAPDSDFLTKFFRIDYLYKKLSQYLAFAIPAEKNIEKITNN